MTGSVNIVGPSRNRPVIDINMTCQHHVANLPDPLSAHVLIGCDTVALCYGIGKVAAIKTLKSQQYPLDKLGEATRHLDETYNQTSAIMLACYSQSTCHSCAGCHVET